MKQKIFLPLFFAILILHMARAQNVGIGTNNPAYKLDVAGRLRLQNTAQSAGIWFDGTTAPARSFIGTLNNDHVGIYGSGSSWQFVMNVNNGHIGIGNTAPSANLDVSGTMRFRGDDFPNQPRVGATLQALDDAGNTEWQRPVNFKTNGMNGDVTLDESVWTKVLFKSSGLEINEGFYFDPFSSVFNAPVKGFYHFDASVYAKSTTIQSHMRLVVVRNGSFLKEYRSQRHLNLHNAFATDEISDFVENNSKIKYVNYMVSVSILLEKNDQVWMECYRSSYYGESVANGYPSVFKIIGDANGTWFSGFLVNRL
ncbi:MAG: hypothetical protein V4722_16835 [Bacteroidota bacterium]